MPKFSRKSLEILSTCDQNLQLLFQEVVKTFDCKVICGYRGKLAQETAYRERKTTKHWPDSKHNFRPSEGVDVVPYPIDWNNTKQMLYFAGYVMGIAEKLYEEGYIKRRIRAGADWNVNQNPSDENFIDLPHFEVI